MASSANSSPRDPISSKGDVSRERVAAPAEDDRPLIVRFFDASQTAKDARGRTLPQILSWSDDDLEMSHDYIQMLFPLPEGSIFNRLAPVVTPETSKIFHESENLRKTQRRAFVRILDFYGLELCREDSIISVRKGTKWKSNSPNWVTRFDHNHLRITRIIRSLRVLGSGDEAEALYTCLFSLDEVKARVSRRSLMYWERAARRPLHLPPDEDDDHARGVEWLSQQVV